MDEFDAGDLGIGEEAIIPIGEDEDIGAGLVEIFPVPDFLRSGRRQR